MKHLEIVRLARRCSLHKINTCTAFAWSLTLIFWRKLDLCTKSYVYFELICRSVWRVMGREWQLMELLSLMKLEKLSLESLARMANIAFINWSIRYVYLAIHYAKCQCASGRSIRRPLWMIACWNELEKSYNIYSSFPPFEYEWPRYIDHKNVILEAHCISNNQTINFGGFGSLEHCAK